MQRLYHVDESTDSEEIFVIFLFLWIVLHVGADSL